LDRGQDPRTIWQFDRLANDLAQLISEALREVESAEKINAFSRKDLRYVTRELVSVDRKRHPRATESSRPL
jgi:hypothetical protein